MLDIIKNNELRFMSFENSIKDATSSTSIPITIYCDGACSGNQFKENIGGWGAILKFCNHEKEIYGAINKTTNNRMELLACVKALDLIKTSTHKIRIYSDSAYLVDCVVHGYYKRWESNGWRTAQKNEVKNKDLWIRILRLIRKYDITFIKVKAHSTNELNERADALAQKGIDEIKNSSTTFYNALAI